MTSRTVDEMSLRIRFQVLHLRELVVNRTMHGGRFSCGAFWPLVIAQSAAVTNVHDHRKSCRRSIRHDVDVFEHFYCGLLLASTDLFRDFLDETIVDFLDGLSAGLSLCTRR